MGDAKDIVYVILGPEDFDDVAKLITDDFLTREPLSMGSRMSYSARDGAVGSGIKKCLDSGVTVGARDANTGVLAGVRLSYIQTEADSSETKFTNEFEKKVLGIVVEAGSKVNVFQDPGVDKVLYMFMLSVRHDYGGRGIGKKLVQMSMERGKALGCQLAFTTVTNVVSGRIFLGLGYETRYTLDMSTPGGDRGLDLSAMEGNRTVRIMTKRL
ncbi:arylalkylamine N-acetyltransferase-like 2 [Penaeus japonicus]|uniref:arylalkylamine N-acetyltransferase-like 2 n=1 Tax=Penaeus japonicus TaxID=27405 RepID=UPI001C7115E2|nr:arylalkylamine N-acetyltransferase-like 2 [Penaeus japonicus]